MFERLRKNRQTLMILGAMIVPTVVSLGIIWRQGQAGIDFADSERAGIRYQSPLMDALHALGHVERDLLATGTRNDEHAKAVEKAFAAVKAEHATDGESL
jgi:hypothetical protein